LPQFVSASNPIDMTPAIFQDPARAAELVRRIVDLPVDAVAFCSALPGEASDALAVATARALADGGKPAIVTWWLASEETCRPYTELGIPCFTDPRTAFASLASVVVPGAPDRAPELSVEDTTRRPLAGGNIVTEEIVEQSLASFGINVVPRLTVRSRDAAAHAAAALGPPVVLKVLSVDIPHRAQVGALAVNVGAGAEAENAYDLILGRARLHASDERISGVLVQKMVSGSREIYVGVRVDEEFGSVIVIGEGGGKVEERPPLAIGLLPITTDEAVELLAQANSRVVIAEPSQIDDLARILAQISDWWASDHGLGQLAELDLNPILVGRSGAAVADALAIRAMSNGLAPTL
jgi:acetyltransferase